MKAPYNALLRGKRLNPQASKPKQYQPKPQNANRSPESACPRLSKLLGFMVYIVNYG